MRGGEGITTLADTVRGQRRAHEQGVAISTVAAHFLVGRVTPVLATVSSSIGEHQGGVKWVETVMVAQFGKVRQPGKRADDGQSARWRLEHVD